MICSHSMLINRRCWSCRYHKAQSQWLLHCGCRRLQLHLFTLFQLGDTVQSVHAATRKTLLKVKGFSEVKVEKIKEAIAKLQVMPCSCSTIIVPHATGQKYADHTSRASLQHPASSQQLNSVTTGREYAGFRLGANNWILFLEGKSARAGHW